MQFRNTYHILFIWQKSYSLFRLSMSASNNNIGGIMNPIMLLLFLCSEIFCVIFSDTRQKQYTWWWMRIHMVHIYIRLKSFTQYWIKYIQEYFPPYMGTSTIKKPSLLQAMLYKPVIVFHTQSYRKNHAVLTGKFCILYSVKKLYQ